MQARLDGAEFEFRAHLDVVVVEVDVDVDVGVVMDHVEAADDLVEGRRGGMRARWSRR